MSIGGYMYNCTTPGGVTLSLVRFLWSQILSRTAPSLFLCLLLYSVCQHYTVWQHWMTFIWYQLELVPVRICNCMCSHLCDCVKLFFRWWWGNDIWSVTSVCGLPHVHSCTCTELGSNTISNIWGFLHVILSWITRVYFKYYSSAYNARVDYINGCGVIRLGSVSVLIVTLWLLVFRKVWLVYLLLCFFLSKWFILPQAFLWQSCHWDVVWQYGLWRCESAWWYLPEERLNDIHVLLALVTLSLSLSPLFLSPTLSLFLPLSLPPSLL